MSNDLVVGALIALMVAGAVAYLVIQRRRGVSSCGCKTCSHCRAGCRTNVTIEEEDSGKS